MSLDDSTHTKDALVAETVRDPLAAPEAMLAARRRSMSERLELALSWNTLASELRLGLLAVTRPTNHER